MSIVVELIIINIDKGNRTTSTILLSKARPKDHKDFSEILNGLFSIS